MYTDLEPTIRQETRKRAGWGIAVGILLIVLAIVAIALPLATAIARFHDSLSSEGVRISADAELIT